MPGVRNIAMKSIRTTRSRAPWGHLFVKFLLFVLGIFLSQIDVEFDFSTGHALVLFSFLWIINKKCKVNQ